MDRRNDNAGIAAALERVAALFEVQRANPFQVAAYRHAAEVVRRLERPMDGAELPGLGPRTRAAIEELVRTGRLAMLARLEGEVSPEELFRSVPGIGERFAARIHRALGVETLEELEAAAHDGWLEAIEGFGPRRTELVREVLAQRLGDARRRPVEAEHPPVELLLSVDAEYRRLAAAGALPTIAPRRFNPRHERWLPIWHVARDGWNFTAGPFSVTSTSSPCGSRSWRCAR